MNNNNHKTTTPTTAMDELPGSPRLYLRAPFGTSTSFVQPPPPSSWPCCSFRPPSTAFLRVDLLRTLVERTNSSPETRPLPALIILGHC